MLLVSSIIRLEFDPVIILQRKKCVGKEIFIYISLFELYPTLPTTAGLILSTIQSQTLNCSVSSHKTHIILCTHTRTHHYIDCIDISPFNLQTQITRYFLHKYRIYSKYMAIAFIQMQ